ncbi:MAG: flippase-like domain-containing protein [Lachnospiraceae bacterium]|nr:flippase-like domain-containing protein [Lachnospiraceae bacterium]
MSIFKLAAGIVIFILGFLAVHTIKLFRMYLVLLESRIRFSRFVFAYCRTTLANLVIPFKLGEIYRMTVFSRITKSAGTGIAGVIVDRFFDTMALVLILLPLHILYPSKVSVVSVFLVVFIVLIVFVYATFPSAYRYLNRYIIINRGAGFSMTVLKWLEVLNSGYENIRQLVKGRYALLILMSFASWVLEGGLLYVVAKIIGEYYDASVFSDYITSIMSTTSSMLQSKYILFSIALMAICTLFSGIVYAVVKSGRKDKVSTGVR